MSFMGWSVERKSGAWYASKVTDDERYSPAGIVRVRRLLYTVSPDATKSEAEREVVRLYRSRYLN